VPSMWSDDDYRARLVNALDSLDELIDEALKAMSHDRGKAILEHRRLRGKRDGINLALSYFDEMVRCRGERASCFDEMVRCRGERAS
jgi:hypothetical protein